MRSIVLIAHNIRSTHNVGSLLRTADGLGISKVFLTGYTPYPTQKNDSRLPHLSQKLTKQIQKTALGAEESVEWEYSENVNEIINRLRLDNYTIVALEQAKHSIALPGFVPSDRLAIIIGREVEGIELEILKLTDTIIEIPMFGTKESFNVAQATAIALYHCRFYRWKSTVD